MAGPGDLYAVAREYLLACADAVATAPGGPISRLYVAPGPPAFDCCDQLTVHAGGPAEGNTQPLQPLMMPGQRASVTGAVHLVSLTATVLRCVPVVEQTGQHVQLPSANEIDASAVNTCADVWAIWHGIRRAYQAGTLFASDSCHRELFFDPAIPLNTQGGCAGWQVPIRIALSGYA